MKDLFSKYKIFINDDIFPELIAYENMNDIENMY